MRSQRNLRPFLVMACVCWLSLVALAGGPPQEGCETEASQRAPEAVINVPAGDVAALTAAINTANANGEADTIVLGGGTYSFLGPNNYCYGPTALPAILSNITIEGNGAILERSSSAASNFRIFYVDGGLSNSTAGTLRLKNLTLRNGYAKGGNSWYGGGGLGAGGAIFNQGTLVLDNVTISGNTAQGGNIDNSNGFVGGGGGIGESSTGIHGAGFGGASPGLVGGAGGAASGPGGGGGGGFSAQGQNGAGANGGAGGGASLLGGTGGYTYGYGGNPGIGQDGGGGGGGFAGGGGPGGAFGQGGSGSSAAGGGGGVGGGGGHSGDGAGGGGFGGGGGGDCYDCAGNGGFGGGGGSTNGAGGFGGHNGCPSFGGPGAGLGGAIFNMYGSVEASNCTISGNVANGGTSGSSCGSGSGLGGGIFNLDGAVALTSCTITSNTASQSAAALYNLAYANTPSGGASTATVSLADCTLTDLINNQDRSKGNPNVASVTLDMDGTGPTNLIPNGVTNYDGTVNGTAASACFSALYGDPAGSCDGQNPCYTRLWRILSLACDDGTVSLSGGIYADALTVSRNLTVNLSGDIEFPGSVTQTSGTLNATTGTWTIRGDLLLNGGSFNAGGGTVLFGGSGSQSAGGSGTIPLFNAWFGDGAWGYWKFDEGSGATAADSSGSGRTGTLEGTAGWSTAAPPISSDAGSLAFHGSGGTDESVTVSGTPGTNAYTIAAWVRPDDYWSRNIVTMTSPSGPAASWSQQIRTSGGHFEHYLWDSSGYGAPRTVTGTTPLSPGVWTHVAAVAAAGGSMLLYVNGISEGTPVAIGKPQEGNDRMEIGVSTGGGFLAFNGLVDELRAFPRALSAPEVLKLYNGGTEGWWKLDESSGATSFADASGHGHTGTCAAGACPTAGQPGVIGTAVSFGGTDAITIPWDTSTTPYTLSTWVKPADNWDRDILVRTGPLGPLFNWSEQIRTQGGRFQHYLYDESSGSAITQTGTAPIVPGTWYHVAAVATPGGTMKLYVNGVLQGKAVGIGTPQGGLDCYMLGAASNGIEGFSGLMDDTRIYRRALSASEVAALAAGKNPVGPLNTVTLGQPLDAGGTVTLSDATLDVGTGNQAVTVGGDWVLDGGSFEARVGAVTFDGTGVQNLVRHTEFYDLTVGSDSILTTSGETAVGGYFTNFGWTDETKAITGTGSMRWSLAGITTNVATQGTLASLRVKRRDQSHPYAPPGLQTGKYWNITPTGSDYSVNLTLPQQWNADPQACRYESGRWDYGRTSFNSSSVTRNGVTAFSDWTVGDGVPSPPPVGDGRNGTTAALFVKSGTTLGQIDVTYDAAHCSAQRAVILYGSLDSIPSGYTGLAQCDAGNSGSASFDSSALANVWFNIVWENGTIAGNPGYGFDGTSDVQRTWTVSGTCGVTADAQDVPACP